MTKEYLRNYEIRKYLRNSEWRKYTKVRNFRKLEHFKTKDELVVYELFLSEGHNPIWQYQIGRYIADFVFKKEKVIVELNGFAHSVYEHAIEKDKLKASLYKSRGWLVINIDYKNIEDDWDEIKDKVLRICMLLEEFDKLP